MACNRIPDRTDHVLGVDALLNKAVLGSGHQHVNAGDARRLLGEGNDGYIRSIADAADRLDAVGIREKQIEQHGIEIALSKMLQSLYKRRDPDNLNTLAGAMPD